MRTTSNPKATFIVKWRCRFNNFGGAFLPTSEAVADHLIDTLSRLFPDYEYTREEVAGAVCAGRS
jgi:hypothetical protein